MTVKKRSRGPKSPARSRREVDLDGFVEEEGGAVYVEYITLVVTMGIIIALAIISLGVPLLNTYRMTHVFLGAPVP